MSGGAGALSSADIMALLPHRHPLLLLDRVDDLVPGISAVGVKNISIADPVFAGHFPGRPIYPGVYLIEVAAQLSGIVLAATSTEPALGYLAGVKRFKFVEVVVPGDQLIVSTTRRVALGALTEFAVEIRAGRRLVAGGSLSIALSAAE